MGPKCNSRIPVRGSRGNIERPSLGEGWPRSRNTHSPQKLEEARTGPPLQSPEGAQPHRHLDFSPGTLTSDLWLPEKINVCRLMLSTRCSFLQQPQKLIQTLGANPKPGARGSGGNARDRSQHRWSEIQNSTPTPVRCARPDSGGEGRQAHHPGSAVAPGATGCYVPKVTSNFPAQGLE